jgi:biofilm PGA synthesis N-glycosyltransferase PgaC
MRRTLDSVASQSLRPALWIIIDDGSSDDTPRILDEYAARLPFLRVVRRPDRGRRAVGPGVIDAFYAGLAAVNLDDFDYLCKLDLDLDLPPRYFETLVQRMEDDPALGTCSGKAYFPDPRTGRLISEGCGDETSLGMTKFYRTDCFRQIGGFVRQVMWDGIDNHRCRMLGWKARSWDDPQIRFTHLRPMGSSYRGIWTGRKRHGFGQYFMGTGPAYLLASAASRLFKRPPVIGSLAMLAGYLQAMLAGTQRYDDPAFRAYLRRFQRRALLRGKHFALRLAEIEAPPLPGGGPSYDPPRVAPASAFPESEPLLGRAEGAPQSRPGRRDSRPVPDGWLRPQSPVRRFSERADEPHREPQYEPPDRGDLPLPRRSPAYASDPGERGRPDAPADALGRRRRRIER